jgi:Holliday junction DNA helicase RuvB
MSEVNDVQPTSLKHLESKSQKSVLEMVSVWLEVCFIDQVKFPNCLMTGPAGTGKTSLCEVIASELQVPIQITLGHTLRTPADLNAVLLKATDRSIVAVDEADLMPVPVQTALMVAISSGRIFLPAGGSVQSLPLANMTFLLATTEEWGLLGPATQRFNTLRFSYYCEEDLRNIVAVRARSLGWGIADEAVSPIAERSRGTPRIALKILQASRSVCRAEGEDTISLAHLNRASRLMGLDVRGLNKETDLAYMRLLQDSHDGTQLSVLASRLGIPTKTVTTVIEPFLLREGLIEKGGKQSKRILTAKGKEHLQEVGDE